MVPHRYSVKTGYLVFSLTQLLKTFLMKKRVLFHCLRHPRLVEGTEKVGMPTRQPSTLTER